jgi:hypothetical protein
VRSSQLQYFASAISYNKFTAAFRVATVVKLSHDKGNDLASLNGNGAPHSRLLARQEMQFRNIFLKFGGATTKIRTSVVRCWLPRLIMPAAWFES